MLNREHAQPVETDLAISVSGVGKCYRAFHSQRARLLHALFPSTRHGMEDIWALRDVSFEVQRGQSVGIIGRNGSGKSSLLEIITGTLTPTTGAITVKGRIAALLELGSGFNPEYTGRENVYLNGLILGLNRDEIDQRFDEIAAFADIGAVLDRPVKTYSSGMLVRLAFAVPSVIEPDILIVDEALSVGDFFFQQKCLSRLRELQHQGTTVLFVSHDMQTVRDLCQKGLYLDRGQVAYWGDNLTAINRYLARPISDAEIGPPNANSEAATHKQNKQQNKPTHLSRELSDAIWSNKAAAGIEPSILSVGVYDATGKQCVTCDVGQSLKFLISFQLKGLDEAHPMLTIKNRYDQIVSAFGSYTLGTNRPSSHVAYGLEHLIFQMEVPMTLEAGSYTFRFALGLPSNESAGVGKVLDETPWLGPIQICCDYDKTKPKFYGMVGLDVRGEYLYDLDAGSRGLV